ncbi:N-acetyltransferase [Flavobacterium alkalisoli]|uniref:N-acetyltransferase GCN5 n=2 Tax=Flavobacterium TaxID=237 RepID=A0A444WAL9_9FLAO|nr:MULTISPECIES: GNAT family N-acetyltransferase [Flavobacterium]QEE50267.1 N-acetyltransferase [Flavobacterium alkalisoli]RYJ42818.1 N-acetyltransferase GCN5 [Flavobacterium beibuense]
MEILLQQGDSKGHALARENEKRAGMMTYSIAGPELIIIDHTEVEPAYNGKGVGKQMLYKIVEMAREKEVKIIPLCPFAAMMFKKSEDIKDVLKS